jgi:hypothetical protein
MPLYRWTVYPNEPAPPAGLHTPWGYGETPEAALADLRRNIERQREQSAEPARYFDELITRMSRAD